jgi:PAS domain S-box-containing protein
MENLVKNKRNLSQWLLCYQKAIDSNIIASVTDNKGVIIYVNKKFCDVSKYSKVELVGKSHSIVNSGHHPKKFFIDLWKTLNRGEIWTGEIKNMDKNGDNYWVDTVIIPVKLENKTQFLSLRTVITEKKEAEKKREEYLKSLEKLLFFTSHKVRGPLTSFLGLIQLENQNFSKKDLRIIFNHIKSSADDLDKFTRELTKNLQDLKEIMK